MWTCSADDKQIRNPTWGIKSNFRSSWCIPHQETFQFQFQFNSNILFLNIFYTLSWQVTQLGRSVAMFLVVTGGVSVHILWGAVQKSNAYILVLFGFLILIRISLWKVNPAICWCEKTRLSMDSWISLWIRKITSVSSISLWFWFTLTHLAALYLKNAFYFLFLFIGNEIWFKVKVNIYEVKCLNNSLAKETQNSLDHQYIRVIRYDPLIHAV